MTDFNDPTAEYLKSLTAGGREQQRALYAEAPVDSLTRSPERRKQQGLFDRMVEGAKYYGRAVVHGAADAVDETVKTVAWAGETASAALTGKGSTQTQAMARIHREGLRLSRSLDSVVGADDAHGAGAFVRDMVHFAVGFAATAPLGGIGGLAKAGKAAKFAVAAGRGALVDAFMFDPNAERVSDALADMTERAPSFIHAPLAALSHDVDDSEAESRLKAAAEGILLGTTVEGVLAGAKLAWRARTAAGRGKLGEAVNETRHAILNAAGVGAGDVPRLAEYTKGEAGIVRAPKVKGAASEALPEAKAPEVEPFDIVEQPDGSFKVDSTETPGAEGPVFATRAEAEANAAAANYFVKSDRAAAEGFKLDDVQAAFIRDLAYFGQKTGRWGKVAEAMGDVNLRFDGSDKNVLAWVDGMSEILRKEIHNARKPEDLMRLAKGELPELRTNDVHVTNAESLTKAREDWNGKTPGSLMEMAEQDIDRLQQMASRSMAVRILRVAQGAHMEKLARIMDNLPDNDEVYRRWLASLSSTAQTFLVEKGYGSGAGRLLQTFGRKVTAAGMVEKDGALLDGVEFRLADDPVDDTILDAMRKLDEEDAAKAAQEAQAKPDAEGATPKPEAEPTPKPEPSTRTVVHMTKKQARELASHFTLLEGDPDTQMAVIENLLGLTRKRGEVTPSKLQAMFQHVIDYRRWAMLSAPTTAVVNAVSAATYTLARPVEGLVGALVTLDAKAARRQADVLQGSVMAAFDAFRQASKAFASGKEILEPGAVESMSQFNLRPVTGGDFFANIWNVASISQRIQLAGDEFSKQMAYRGHTRAQLLAVGREQGLSGEALKQYARENMGGAVTAEGRALNAPALFHAQDIALRRSLDYGVGQMMEEVAAKMPAFRILMPFLRVPTNIMRANMERLPVLGLLAKRNRDEVLNAFRTGEIDDGMRDVIGKQVTGLAVYSGAAYGVMTDQITGGGPKDPELRALWSKSHQPYSIKIGEQWVSYRRLEPVAAPLGIMADIAEMAQDADEESHLEAVMEGVAQFAKNSLSKTYMRGLSDFFDALNSGQGAKWETFMANMAGSFVPNVAQRANLDEEARVTRTFLERIQARVPGFSNDLEARRNIYGEKVRRMPEQYGYAQTVMNPFTVRSSKELSDPVDIELYRVGLDMKMPPTTKYGVDLTERGAMGMKGNQSAYDRWLEIMSEPLYEGKNLKQTLREVIASEEYKAASNGTPEYPGGVKRLIVERVVRNFREAAFAKLVEENQGVLSAIEETAVQRGLALTDDPDVSSALRSSHSNAAANVATALLQ